MSEKLNKLIETAIASRYKVGPWGYVAFPKVIVKVGQIEIDENSERHAYNSIYERVWRYRELAKSIGWPIGRHNWHELKQHFETVLGKNETTEMLLSQADVFVRAWKSNIKNSRLKTADGARAFLEIWRHVESQSGSICNTCKYNTLKRSKLSSGDLQKV